MERKPMFSQDFTVNGNYQLSPMDPALFEAANNHYQQLEAAAANGSHHHPPNPTFWEVEPDHPGQGFMPTINHQPNSDFLVPRNQINANHLPVMNGNNLHAAHNYIDNLLASEFSRLSMVPVIQPNEFAGAITSFDGGSSSLFNAANGVFLSHPSQMGDLRQMRVESAARGLCTHPQINSGFEGIGASLVNSNLNGIWGHNNITNPYNNSGRNLNLYNLPESSRNGFGSSSSYNSFMNSHRSLAVDGNERRRAGPIGRRLNLTSLQDLRGRIFFVAKDQRGCRFLQEKLEKGNPEEINMIIMEIKDHVCELMVDQFGNYLFPKYLTACTNQNHQLISELLLLVTRDQETFKSICVDSQGSRSVQKLLEYLTTQEQRSHVVSVLKYITVPLITSINGHHVIQYCLKNFSPQDNEKILSEVADNCMEIALDKSGCSVLQQCVEPAVGRLRERLIHEITSNALLLSEHPFGNYVVQYIQGLKIPLATLQIMAQLSGNFATLSMNKFGSNVVEKFLKHEPNDEQVVPIIQELICSPLFLRVLQDPYGNYVAQSAFKASKGTLRMTLKELIQTNYTSLHSHPHGKRVYACIRA